MATTARNVSGVRYDVSITAPPQKLTTHCADVVRCSMGGGRGRDVDDSETGVPSLAYAYFRRTLHRTEPCGHHTHVSVAIAEDLRP